MITHTHMVLRFNWDYEIVIYPILLVYDMVSIAYISMDLEKNVKYISPSRV